MAINVNFNGQTIYKPGAYSKVEIDLGGAFPLGPTGLIGIVGESTRGEPGSAEASINTNYFTAQQIPELIAKYGSGPIVDAASFLFSPAADGAIPSGAQAVYVYKTNASTQASVAVPTLWGTVKSLEYGIGGNRITYKNSLTAEVPATAASLVTFNAVTAIADGAKFDLYVKGGPVNTFTAPVGTITAALLQTALTTAGNWSAGLPVGITFAVTGADATATLTVSLVNANAHRLGYTPTFELVDGVSTPLALMNITPGLKIASVIPAATITVNQKRDLIVESDILGGNVVLEVQCASAVVSATMTIDSSKVVLKEDAVQIAQFSLGAYGTIKALIDDMALTPGWTFSLTSALYNQLSPFALDAVTDLGCMSSVNTRLPAKILKSAAEVVDFFATSGIVSLVIGANSVAGLPDEQTEVALSGGVTGATSPSSIVDGLTAFTGVRLNAVVPLFSRDATADIADFLTDIGSTYTIDAVHQAVKTHLSLMSGTAYKSERQGYLSYKASFNDCMIKSNTLADPRIQLLIQDTKNIDAQGNILWFQPWSLACMFAGARSGAPIGTPMTFKYFNCSGIRQTAQAMTTAEVDIVNDFNPSTQYEIAIKNGITFLDAPQSGGFRCVVDNTTYGKDGNWVYNRGNVLYASDILMYDFRNQLENIYVGSKNNVKVTEVKSVCETILNTYLSQGITVSTADAPNGFKGLTVKLEGNTIFVTVTVKLVEGIDFVLITTTVQRAAAQA